VIVDGLVYDVTPFLDRHPGGKEMLLLAAGRECTDLFNSYHWSNPDKPRQYMKNYEIGVLVGPSEFPVYAPDTKGFYATLSKRVKAHFERTGENPKNPFSGLWRLAVQMTVGITCFLISVGVLLPGLSFPLRCLAAWVYGVFQVMPLLHAMHDASHTAIGPHEGWWKTIGRVSLDWYAGGSMISWHHQHIVGHHVYTNIFKADPDIPMSETTDMRRLVPVQVWRSVYAFQWLYLPVLYTLLAFKVRWTDVTDTWIARDSGPIRVNFYDSAFVRVFLSKGFWAFWRFYFPLAILGLDQASFWTLFFVTELSSGMWLAWNFEVSHLAPDADFPVSVDMDLAKGGAMATAAKFAADQEAAAKGGKAAAAAAAAGEAAGKSARSSAGPSQLVIPRCWAVVQVESSVDYGHNSWWTAWWSGALNYQIEHHLFPGISQYQYPAIAGIVKDTCK
jgi:fatty acid desaturase